MSTLERCPRREGFSEGRWLTGADGSRWCLPVLDEAAWGRFASVRKFYAMGETLRYDDAGEVIQDEGYVVGLGQLFQEILFELVEANYRVADPLELWTILMTPEGRLHQEPFGPIVQTIRDAGKILMKYMVAERNGIGVGEAAYLLSLGEGSSPLLGWHDHDGPLFDN